jgi:hypothetical protein
MAYYCVNIGKVTYNRSIIKGICFCVGVRATGLNAPKNQVSQTTKRPSCRREFFQSRLQFCTYLNIEPLQKMIQK